MAMSQNQVVGFCVRLLSESDTLRRGTKMRLPSRQLTLPGGFLIRVQYITDRQMKYCNLDAWGYWQQGKTGGVIRINSDAPVWRQIKTFGHELLHAVHDYQHWLDGMAEAIQEEAAQTAKELEEDDEA